MVSTRILFYTNIGAVWDGKFAMMITKLQANHCALLWFSSSQKLKPFVLPKSVPENKTPPGKRTEALLHFTLLLTCCQILCSYKGLWGCSNLKEIQWGNWKMMCRICSLLINPPLNTFEEEGLSLFCSAICMPPTQIFEESIGLAAHSFIYSFLVPSNQSWLWDCLD